MISKELLSEVLKENIVEVYKIGSNPNFKQNTLLFKLYECGELCSINIYELAHKCKEWALSKGYYLHSHTKEYSDCWCIVKSLDNITQQLSCKMDTEVEAIIKACEWILSKIKEGN